MSVLFSCLISWLIAFCEDLSRPLTNKTKPVKNSRPTIRYTCMPAVISSKSERLAPGTALSNNSAYEIYAMKPALIAIRRLPSIVRGPLRYLP